MNGSMLILDIGFPGGGVFALGLGIGFFIVLAAAAFIVFRLLRKTLRLAFRIAIVAVIMAIAGFGSIALLWFGSGVSERPRPTPVRKK